MRLGATWTGEGVHFAVRCEHASRVELALFADPRDAVPTRHLDLTREEDGVWRRFVPEARPGMAYGWRAHGPYAPLLGRRMDPTKLLCDPYALAVAGPLRWNDAICDDGAGPRAGRDSAPYVPRALVVDEAFDWSGERRPRVPWQDTVLYECHVRGLTRSHPEVPENLRGTYLGLAQAPVTDHLLALGVTSVQLLPVHHFVSERALVARGLCNYWGYNPLAFLAPHSGYATSDLGSQVTEFKTMVKALHAAGLEVILDVVFNHTAEQGRHGPTLSLRGLDNAAYYRLAADNRTTYEDFTGCGNTLDLRSDPALELVLSSLRYWVTQMHVDGFRLDLATALAREPHDFTPEARLFEAVRRDATLREIKLIAEPWDTGPGGYQLGRFPLGVREWNDRYRDTLRRFWRGDGVGVAELASRLAGSSDIFGRRATPLEGINFVTCHDGFTLEDLVSYERKHNEANGEDNCDGSDHNLSTNLGEEGPTLDAEIGRQRTRTAKSLIASLLFSRGVPMLSMGDEICRTQRGNNNAFCQDSELSWMSWAWNERERDMLEHVRRALALRREHRLLRAETFLTGDVDARGRKDVAWLKSDGTELTNDDWLDPGRRELAMVLCSERPEGQDGATADALLLALNANALERRFVLPLLGPGRWLLELATAEPTAAAMETGAVLVPGRSLVLLRHTALPTR